MLIDEAFCSFVLADVKSGNISSLTWALALAQAEGNERHAQAIYVKLRVEELRRKWQATPLCKIPEGLAFGQASVFHNGMLIPYSDVVSITLYSNFTQWQTGSRIGDSVTTSRSFLFRLATQYHVIEFSKLCLFSLKSEDYEPLFRNFSSLADDIIIPRLAQQYIQRLTHLNETVAIAGIKVDQHEGIRSTTLGFGTHLPGDRFHKCKRSNFSSIIEIFKNEHTVWKSISCKEPNAVLLPTILNTLFSKQ